MTKIVLTLLSVSALLVGCGKEQGPPPPPVVANPPPLPPPLPAPAAQPAAPAPNAPAPGAPGAAPVPAPGAAPSPDLGLPPTAATLAQKSEKAEDPEKILPAVDALNLLVNEFRDGYGRYPNTVEELVQARLLPKLPTPPAGKRFSMDTKAGKVVLVNQ